MNIQDKYGGKYIATRSFNDHTVIAYGKDPVKVIGKARKICDSPVVMWIPPKGEICI